MKGNDTYFSRLTLRLIMLASLLSVVSAGTANQKTEWRLPSELRFHVEDHTNQIQTLALEGASDRHQLLVSGIHANENHEDYTHKVNYHVQPKGIVSIDQFGWLQPMSDGTATLTAKHTSGLSTSLQISVTDFEVERPINFANKIVPIFTKTGCNGGGCHGKSSGQNGFRLSLLGFEPTEDFEHLVLESRGRRLFPAAPEHSLLLRKAVAEVPHGGGKRIDKDSVDYALITRWIQQGMPYGQANDPVVQSIEVFPKQRLMQMGGSQQLIVVAHYSDGSKEDVTRSALFEANVKEMAEVTEEGQVQLHQQPGEVAVMIRYQAQVAVFRATIPLGAPVKNLPAPNNFIDEWVFKKLESVGMPPSELTDDSTFLRRVTLDVAGRLPTSQEANDFLKEENPDKRASQIDQLLEDPGYGALFANKWSALLRNKQTKNTDKRGTYLFHDWIRESMQQNMPYDDFVGSILTASGDITDNPPVAWYRQVKQLNEQVEDTAQLFLGLRLQCAQCHHHPFEKWSQHDYYSLAAFFSRVGRAAGTRPGEEVIFHKPGEAKTKNIKTDKAVLPAGLGVAPATIRTVVDPRLELARWLTNDENPFFAKSVVNRYWKHFFGRGIVDPEDDMRETNPPTHPELLDALASHFIYNGYDLKDLVRTICQSKVYQLSAIPNQHNGVDKQHYSRYYPKRLMAEVLYDSVHELLGSEVQFDGLPLGTKAVELPNNSFNSSNYFLTVFGRPDSSSSCECERSQDASLAQSLHLLNSKSIQEKLAAKTGMAAVLVKDTSRSHEEKMSELYLMAFSRFPSTDELNTALEYLNRKQLAAATAIPPEGEESKEASDPFQIAYEDIIWALINTKEFLFNH
jgi:hypothetical protein